MRGVFLIALSLGLFFCDYQLQFFQPLRQVLAAVVYPIHFLADTPSSFAAWFGENVATHKSLVQENTQLKTDQLPLQAKVQQVTFLERENAQLRAMLGLASHITNKVMLAQLLAVDVDEFGHEAILNKGSKDGVYIGQPVLDNYGVMGQVVEISDFSSRVMLVDDSRSAVPVINIRNGMRAIAVGASNSGLMELAHVPDTADVKMGDVLVTSGVGLLAKSGAFGESKLGYPAGYSVGVVGQVTHVASERFAKVVVVPTAHVDSSRYVLLLSTDTYVQGTLPARNSDIKDKKDGKNKVKSKVKNKDNSQGGNKDGKKGKIKISNKG